MSLYSIPVLGKYVVLQNDLFKNRSEGSLIRQKEQDFFVQFAHNLTPRLQVEPLVQAPCETERLIDMTVGAQEILFAAKAAFPSFMLPDTIGIDRQKLTITHRNFFRVSNTASIQIKDIKNVQANIGPIFGTLIITSKHFLNNTQTINYLKREDIIKIRQLLQGFMIAHRAIIDTDDIDSEQLTSLLNDLGRG